MASLRRTFGEDDGDMVLTCALDAGDFGKPKESTMLYAVNDGVGAGWALPMVIIRYTRFLFRFFNIKYPL